MAEHERADFAGARAGRRGGRAVDNVMGALAHSKKPAPGALALVAAGSFAVLASCGLPVPAQAQTAPAAPTPPAAAPAPASAAYADTLTGDWGGLRTQWSNAGIDISSGFKGELAGNVHGGPPPAWAEAGEFDLGVTLDTRKLFGVVGGTLQMTITIREGNPPPGALLQQSEEVYGRGDIARLTEFWYQQKLFDDHLTVRFGRMPQGDFNNFSCDFMNLTFCGAPGGNIVGNYWYNWPIAQWAAWARIDVGDYDFMAGVYENNPTDLNLSFAPGLFQGATGAIGQVEIGWSPKFGPNALQGHYQIGVWDDTAGGDDVLTGANGQPFALTGLPPQYRSPRYGFYAQARQQLTGVATYSPDAGWKNVKGLNVFLNFVAADSATSVLNNQIAGGFAYAAPFDSRPNDTVGIAFGRTNYNSRAAESMALANPGIATPSAEYPLEIYYSYQVKPWFDVRPDFQFIVQPGGYAHTANEIILGVRSDIKF
jgi:porin